MQQPLIDQRALTSNPQGNTHGPTQIGFKNSIPENQEQSIRDLEIDAGLFMPQDQMRPWARGFSGKIDPADLFGGGPPKT